MKKKLEADLMSIAHRILQMKNKSDINQLCIETQKLYEKLSVLRFVEEHFAGAKPTIGQAEVVEKMKQFFEDENLSEIKPIQAQNEIVVEEITKEVIVEQGIIDDKIESVLEQAIDNVTEHITEIDLEEEIIIVAEPETIKESNTLGFMPAFELDIENKIDEPQKPEPIQISFEDLLGGNYDDSLFVKVDSIENSPTATVIESAIKTESQLDVEKNEKINADPIDSKTVSLNEKMAKGLTIDLNDRIAFVKHLFGNSDEDYNRVLNQLITYDNFAEAQNFIDGMVKPDYNNWEGKDDYSKRFIEIIEKKFD